MRIRLVNTTHKLLAMTLLALVLFLAATQFRQPPVKRIVNQRDGLVVIAAPVQILMYAGDRYLAADLETIRIAAIGPSEREDLGDYRLRAHGLVSELNPCHQDNYMLANAMLTWGGSAKEGNNILQRATECRYWDEIPPFLLGFNRYFFNRDIKGAIEAINIAGSRNEENRTAMKQIAIIMASKQLNDVKMAAAYLRQQRDEATDQQMKRMLGFRLQRLEGLITLRDAQSRYEQQMKRPLLDPNELISKGILETFPQDPLRIGYEFVGGRFQLRPKKIAGVEIR